ncbi:MAG: YEATS-associated helix-containing protein [Saprospiraceae bacterium]
MGFSDCNFHDRIFSLYAFITIVSTLIGAMAAVALDDEIKVRVLKDAISGWKKKLIMAFVASAATPLFLELTDKSRILSDSSSEGCNVLLYFSYALILASFGESVLKKLALLLNIGVESLKSLFTKQGGGV